MSRALSCLLLIFCGCGGALRAAAEVERIRNSRVVAVEYTLPSGETLAMESRPAVTVYLDPGTLAQGNEFGSRHMEVERGQVLFTPAGAVSIRNLGAATIRFVRIEFAGGGSKQIWGKMGLAPGYKVVLENTCARVYDIRIPAGTKEPQHTHHDRVVVCLSGARLRHLMQDGREETATLETGEVAWRAGTTHVGENLGDTDLWVIAVEPK